MLQRAYTEFESSDGVVVTGAQLDGEGSPDGLLQRGVSMLDEFLETQHTATGLAAGHAAEQPVRVDVRFSGIWSTIARDRGARRSVHLRGHHLDEPASARSAASRRCAATGLTRMNSVKTTSGRTQSMNRERRALAITWDQHERSLPLAPEGVLETTTAGQGAWWPWVVAVCCWGWGHGEGVLRTKKTTTPALLRLWLCPGFIGKRPR